MKMSEKLFVPYEVVELLFDLDAKDKEFNRVLIQSANKTVECGKRLFEVSYLAGYDEISVPAPIVEAITKLFMFKRNAFLELQKGNTDADKHAQMTRAVPEEIKELLEPYARKRH